MHIKDRDLYSVDINSSFRFDMAEIIAAGGGGYEPAISSMSVEYKDTGYYEMRNKYCAAQRGGSVEQYIDANITGLSSEVGVRFPKKIVESYRQFMTNGGVFRVSLNPAEETKLSGMEFYESKDVLDMLGVEIAINNVVVDRSKLDWGKLNEGTTISKKTQKLLKRQPPMNAEVRPAPRVESKGNNAQFRTVPKSELARHIGKYVQVGTVGGKQRQGVLESVDAERVRILVKLGGGEFSFPVKLVDIKLAQVYM
jgi:ribosome maturation factor RimP